MENFTTTEEYFTRTEEYFTTSTEFQLPETSQRDVLQDTIIIHYVIFGISIVASFVTCITSVKSNKIEKLCRNAIVMHWSFFEIVHLIAHILSMIFKTPSYHECLKHHCMLHETEGILTCIAFLYFILLLIDSLSHRNENLKAKFKDTYKLLIGGIYVVTGLCFLIFSQFCGDCIYHDLPQNVVYTYFIFLIITIIFNVHILSKARDTTSQYGDPYPNLNLALIDIVLFMCLPSNVWNLISKHIKLKISVVQHVTTIIKISNQIVIMAVLVIIDKNFRAALKQIIKCQCRRRQYIVNVKKKNFKL